MQTVNNNKKAQHDFFIEDKFEAGIVLLGWEVKSARNGSVNLADSYVYFNKGEAYLKNAHISPYAMGDVTKQDTKRDRKLLLNANEIEKIHFAVKAKGFTCVATKIYFNKQGRVKLEIALARGKQKFDKKQVLKERDIMREAMYNQ